MKRPVFILATCVVSALAMLLALAPIASGEQAPAAAEAAKNPDDWLLNVPDEQARLKMLQDQFRGFSASMFEVGRRFETLYDAIADKNYEFATYQTKKLKEVIQLGTMRRPNRKANAEAIFIGGVFESALAEIKSGDPDKAWAAFAKVRGACMACHEAEKVPYMNNQPLFRKTEKPKE